MIIQETYAPFAINNSTPKKFIVRQDVDIESETRQYFVIADYEWCERIICSNCYLNDANEIAGILGCFLSLPVEKAA